MSEAGRPNPARVRVVVTGASGMLGRAVVDALTPDHDVVPLRRVDCDLSDAPATEAWFLAQAPQAIVHAAAWTDVDGCETDPARAWRDNATATANVTETARRCGASVLAVSTDYVFDGTLARPYREDDPTAPLNVYGRSKRAAEEHVLAAGGCVVRTSWLFGPGGRNFVRTMARVLRREPEVRVVDDQTGSPTYTRDLAMALRTVLDSGQEGIFHLTNSGACSWYEFARAIAAALGTHGRVLPTQSAVLGRPARRPRNSVLDNGRSLRQGWPPLRPWEEALRAYLEAAPAEVSEGGT